MKSNYKKIGDQIRLIDERNLGLKVNNLLGLSITKEFIPSVANTIGTDMENYKIIKKNQFACSIMQVRRDKKMPVALFKEAEQAIVSQAYPIFEVIDTSALLPEYLIMWFSRSEFDREACFHAIGGVRGSLEWEDFCNMSLPIPSASKQEEIVREFKVIENRIILNKNLIAMLEEVANSIYKKWFIDFEFPDETGKPYKSSNGDMVWNEELNKEIPKGWEYLCVGDISIIKAGGDKPKNFSENKKEECRVPVYSNSSENEGLFGYTNQPVITEPSVTVSARGAIIGYTALRTIPFVPVVRLLVVTPKQARDLNYIYFSMKSWKYDDSGSAQGQLTIPDISIRKLLNPDLNLLNKFHEISSILLKKIELKKEENLKLEIMRNLLLSKLAKIC